MTIKVAINGMGRIGRSTLAAIIESGRSDIEVISINAPAPIETLVHLMKLPVRVAAALPNVGFACEVGQHPPHFSLCAS